MRRFEEYNPVSVALYFASVTGIAMFCLNPILLVLSLLGSLSLFFLRNGRREGRSHLAYLGLFLVLSLVNPLVSHNGVTVLFVINDSPITAEALAYGVAAAGMVISVLYWFRSFTQIMTAERLLYLFGKLSPRLALVLSMGLRYVTLFQAQARRVRQTQTALGLYKEDNILDHMRGSLRVWSVMVTWALENGIVTADSMAARGYGIGKRSHFSRFTFGRGDWILLVITAFLFMMTCVSAGMGALDVMFYPSVRMAPRTPVAWVGYASYGILVLLPIMMEGVVKIKWKSFVSKI
ncbi:MAG: cobalt transport protein [Clostridia bacterium]|nr:cobalt transport protein [Clostridia bacterium]